MIGAEREGGHDIEADLSCAVSVEQFGRELAEAQALPDMAFGGAEANGDRLDRSPASIKDAIATNSSAGCMAARIVFSISEVSQRRFGLFDQARHLEAGREHAFGGEFLQDLEPPAAGNDGVHVLGRRPSDERRGSASIRCARMLASSSASSAAEEGVLRTLVGDSTSLSSGILRRADLAVMAGTPCDGRAGAVSRPVKPVTNPLSALFL